MLKINPVTTKLDLVGSGGGSGDITAVGDVTSGAAFDGTAGTTLTAATGSDLSLFAGASIDAGRSVVILASSGGANNGGGAITATAGDGSDAEAGGAFTIVAGQGGADGNGGAVTITAGDSGGSSGNGGNIDLSPGTGVSSNGAVNIPNGNLNITALTASEIVITDGSKNLISAAVATYPSLSELAYVKGVTSAVQTQLSGKANTALSNLTSVAVNTSIVSDTDSTDNLGSTTVAWANVYADNIKSITGNALTLTPIDGSNLEIALSTTGIMNVVSSGTNFEGAITLKNTANAPGSLTSILWHNSAGTLQAQSVFIDSNYTNASLRNTFLTGSVANIPVLYYTNNTKRGQITAAGAFNFGSSDQFIIGTTGNVSTTGTFDLGHATDTTLARVSAGVVSIEGVNIVTTSSADTLTNKTLTSPTMTAPVLGTPASGTLTNCTGLPIAGLVASTSTAIGVGSIELGHASDTTITRSAAGVLAVEGVVIPSISSTNTFTNKRITQRVVTTTDDSTAVIDVDATDQYQLTAMANATTISTTGTPTAGQKLIIRLKDNGTARALTWDSVFRAVGVTLPTTTVLSKTVYIGCIYNLTDTKWDAVAVAQEA